MSEIRIPGVCYCDCHAPHEGVPVSVHCFPCCEGLCRFCHRYIVYDLDRHKEECGENARN